MFFSTLSIQINILMIIDRFTTFYIPNVDTLTASCFTCGSWWLHFSPGWCWWLHISTKCHPKYYSQSGSWCAYYCMFKVLVGSTYKVTYIVGSCAVDCINCSLVTPANRQMQSDSWSDVYFNIQLQISYK